MSYDQVLFETERMARRVALTLPQDPFAAAVLSYQFLSAISGVDSSSFRGMNNKRAWGEAYDTLDHAYRRSQLDPNLKHKLDHFLHCKRILEEHRRRLGGSSESFLVAANNRVQLAVAKKNNVKKAIRNRIVTAAILFFFVIVAVAKEWELLGPILVLVFLLTIGYAFVGALNWMAAAMNMRAVHERYAADMQLYQAVEAFANDPNGGGFIIRVANEHPLLTQEPLPSHPSTSFPNRSRMSAVQAIIEPLVIERQVVVTRCRFCQQMTPVDGMACHNCGAPGFGG